MLNSFIGRGGQSALRFARLRMEKRHNYVRKVAEVATQLFITNDKPNISGLILAGSADFKTELAQSDMFDQVMIFFFFFWFAFISFVIIKCFVLFFSFIEITNKNLEISRCFLRWRKWFQSSNRIVNGNFDQR